jgi:hydrogenase nickel incorporation protein HypA/HybF
VHESGLSEAIVGAALKRGAGRRVTAVRVRVGGHPVDPEVVTMGFALAATGTPAEGAELDLVLDPMSVRCNGCGHEAVAHDHLAMVACPRCGSLDVELDGSDEAVLESVTLAETV